MLLRNFLPPAPFGALFLRILFFQEVTIVSASSSPDPRRADPCAERFLPHSPLLWHLCHASHALMGEHATAASKQVGALVSYPALSRTSAVETTGREKSVALSALDVGQRVMVREDDAVWLWEEGVVARSAATAGGVVVEVSYEQVEDAAEIALHPEAIASSSAYALLLRRGDSSGVDIDPDTFAARMDKLRRGDIDPDTFAVGDIVWKRENCWSDWELGTVTRVEESLFGRSMRWVELEVDERDFRYLDGIQPFIVVQELSGGAVGGDAEAARLNGNGAEVGEPGRASRQSGTFQVLRPWDADHMRWVIRFVEPYLPIPGAEGRTGSSAGSGLSNSVFKLFHVAEQQAALARLARQAKARRIVNGVDLMRKHLVIPNFERVGGPLHGGDAPVRFDDGLQEFVVVKEPAVSFLLRDLNPGAEEWRNLFDLQPSEQERMLERSMRLQTALKNALTAFAGLAMQICYEDMHGSNVQIWFSDMIDAGGEDGVDVRIVLLDWERKDLSSARSSYESVRMGTEADVESRRERWRTFFQGERDVFGGGGSGLVDMLRGLGGKGVDAEWKRGILGWVEQLERRSEPMLDEGPSVGDSQGSVGDVAFLGGRSLY